MRIIISDKKAYEEDISSQKIVNYLSEILKNEDSICYYKYPPYNLENNFIPHIVLIDQKYGIFIFQVYSFTNEEIEEENDNFWIVNKDKKYNYKKDLEEYKYLLEADLKNPRKKINNPINIKCIVCFPFFNSLEKSIKNQDTLKVLYDNFESQDIFENSLEKPLDEEDFKKIISIIERIDHTDKDYESINEPPSCLGEAIILNNKKIMVFDDKQRESALDIPYGSNRIRGLAGTGKTIILAWKAAYLHYRYPNKKILYTFYTRSLYNQIERLIKFFYKKHAQKGESINWENLKILHAWGGKGKPGVYYEACIENKINFDSWGVHRFDQNPFGLALKEAIEKELEMKYDYILIDEAQDMPLEFIKLVYKLAKESKNIVVGYDELQSTENIEMGSFEELLKSQSPQKPLSDFIKEDDIILKQSYRNPMKVLHLAVALGLGIYNSTGIIQIIDDEENWKAIGYEVKGDLKENEKVIIERPSENSPNNIEKIYPQMDSLTLNSFKDKKEELEFVVNKIDYLIKKEKVKPEDIIVIELDKSIGKSFDYIRNELYKRGVDSKTPGFSDEADDFFVKDNITLSTPRRAKGNEAPIVFIMGLNNICSPIKDKVMMRINRSLAFISISRTKGWCFLTGNGKDMEIFLEEYKKIMDDFPRFKFRFPTKGELEEIKKINYRTQDEKTKKDYQQIKMNIKDIIKEIKENVYLPEDLLEELKESLNNK